MDSGLGLSPFGLVRYFACLTLNLCAAAATLRAVGTTGSRGFRAQLQIVLNAHDALGITSDLFGALALCVVVNKAVELNVTLEGINVDFVGFDSVVTNHLGFDFGRDG